MPNELPLILVVDDNPRNLQFLGSLLVEQGYEIGLAENGTQALAFVEARQPDLILLDIMMPRVDGFTVCKKLHSNRRTSHIPIIILTAKTETSDIVKGFDLGASDYVTKPFIPSELMARIKTHIEVKQLRHLLSVCSHCRKVRNEDGAWQEIGAYVRSHTATAFTHGLCEACIRDLYGDITIEDNDG